jgi:hypothetical protein
MSLPKGVGEEQPKLKINTTVKPKSKFKRFVESIYTYPKAAIAAIPESIKSKVKRGFFTGQLKRRAEMGDKTSKRTKLLYYNPTKKNNFNSNIDSLRQTISSSNTTKTAKKDTSKKLQKKLKARRYHVYSQTQELLNFQKKAKEQEKIIQSKKNSTNIADIKAVEKARQKLAELTAGTESQKTEVELKESIYKTQKIATDNLEKAREVLRTADRTTDVGKKDYSKALTDFKEAQKRLKYVANSDRLLQESTKSVGYVSTMSKIAKNTQKSIDNVGFRKTFLADLSRAPGLSIITKPATKVYSALKEGTLIKRMGRGYKTFKKRASRGLNNFTWRRHSRDKLTQRLINNENSLKNIKQKKENIEKELRDAALEYKKYEGKNNSYSKNKLYELATKLEQQKLRLKQYENSASRYEKLIGNTQRFLSGKKTRRESKIGSSKAKMLQNTQTLSTIVTELKKKPSFDTSLDTAITEIESFKDKIKPEDESAGIKLEDVNKFRANLEKIYDLPEIQQSKYLKELVQKQYRNSEKLLKRQGKLSTIESLASTAELEKKQAGLIAQPENYGVYTSAATGTKGFFPNLGYGVAAAVTTPIKLATGDLGPSRKISILPNSEKKISILPKSEKDKSTQPTINSVIDKIRNNIEETTEVNIGGEKIKLKNLLLEQDSYLSDIIKNKNLNAATLLKSIRPEETYKNKNEAIQNIKAKYLEILQRIKSSPSDEKLDERILGLLTKKTPTATP